MNGWPSSYKPYLVHTNIKAKLEHPTKLPQNINGKNDLVMPSAFEFPVTFLGLASGESLTWLERCTPLCSFADMLIVWSAVARVCDLTIPRGLGLGFT